jgi:hypothetical protein
LKGSVVVSLFNWIIVYLTTNNIIGLIALLIFMNHAFSLKNKNLCKKTSSRHKKWGGESILAIITMGTFPIALISALSSGKLPIIVLVGIEIVCLTIGIIAANACSN